MNNCVHKLPRVGQHVNLNSYECYFAVKKVIKPKAFDNNCISVTKDFTQQLEEEIK